MSTPDNPWWANGHDERDEGSEAGESLQSLADEVVALGLELDLLQRRIEAAVAAAVPEEWLRHALGRSAALGEETARLRTLTTRRLEDAQHAIARSQARARGELARSLRRTRRAHGRIMPPYKDEAL